MGKIKLNLGCGVKPLKGFVNVDIGDFKADYVHADVRELPFEDDYADYILARQVLEHIKISDIVKTVSEWKRVLKPGGRMIITCPNFNWLFRKWHESEFDPIEYHELTQGMFGNQVTEYEVHRTPITPDFLDFVIASVGFREVDIATYPAGNTIKGYPGIKADKDKVYRFSEVHADLIK